MFEHLVSALHWIQAQHPKRCITNTAGAWLLLKELFTASSEPSASVAAAAATFQSDLIPAKEPTLAGFVGKLAPVLQAYIDQGYATLQENPASPKAIKATPSRKHGSSNGNSNSSDGGEGLISNSSSEAAVTAAVSVAEDGSWRFNHPICLVDEGSNPVFGSLIATLHVLQMQLLQLLRQSAPAATADTPEAEQQQQQIVLPGKAFLQLTALSVAIMHQEAAANSSGSSIPSDHLDVLPCKDIAVVAARMLHITHVAAATKHLKFCCKALQQGCFQSSQPDSGSSSSENADSVLAFKLLLECIMLLQQCGQSRSMLLPLDLLLDAARSCTRQQKQQLIATRGQQLLQVC